MEEYLAELEKRPLKSVGTCDESTRKGVYISLGAVGLSPGQCWFIGIDPTTERPEMLVEWVAL